MRLSHNEWLLLNPIRVSIDVYIAEFTPQKCERTLYMQYKHEMFNNKIVREKNDPHEVVHELIFVVSMILYGISVSGFNVVFLVLCRFNSGNRCSTEGHTHRLKLVSLAALSHTKCTNTNEHKYNDKLHRGFSI